MPEENSEPTREVRTLTDLLNKNGNDALRLAESLLADNARWRDKNRELKAKIPPDGAVVLTAEEAKKWNAFNELGREPKELKTLVTKFPEIEADNARLTKRDKLRSIEALGYDLEVLEERMQAFPEADFVVKTIKDEKDSSRELKIPFVTLDGRESSLDDFGNEHFPKYMSVLKGSTDAQPPKPGNSPDPKPAAQQGNFFERYKQKQVERLEAKKQPVRTLEEAFGRTA